MLYTVHFVSYLVSVCQIHFSAIILSAPCILIGQDSVRSLYRQRVCPIYLSARILFDQVISKNSVIFFFIKSSVLSYLQSARSLSDHYTAMILSDLFINKSSIRFIYQPGLCHSYLSAKVPSDYLSARILSNLFIHKGSVRLLYVSARILSDLFICKVSVRLLISRILSDLFFSKGSVRLFISKDSVGSSCPQGFLSIIVISQGLWNVRV